MTEVYHATHQPATQLPLFILSKTCIDCEKDKELEEFKKAPGNKLGRNARCKQCLSNYVRRKRQEKSVPPPEVLICIDCGIAKPFNVFLKRGAPQRCPECRILLRKKYERQHYLANRDRILARTNKYRAEHKEQYHSYWLRKKNDPDDRRKRNERARRYNRTEQRRAYNRAYLHKTRTGNPEWQKYGRQRYHRPDINQKTKAYFIERNAKPEFKEYRRRYRAAHPEQDVRLAEHKRLKYATNPTHAAHAKEQGKLWRANNPLKVTEMSRRRHAKQRHNTAKRVDYRKILERDGHHCYICDKPIFPHHKMHFDHVIPIAKHGHHVEDNIKPTHACCNMRKNARLLEDMTPFDRRGPDN